MVWAFETEPEFQRKLDWAEEFVRRGGRASIAQIDVVLGQMADRIMAESIRPGAVKIDGNSRDGDAPRGLSCAVDDNSCVVDVQNDAQFRGLAEAMDKPAWLACEDFRAPRAGWRTEV